MGEFDFEVGGGEEERRGWERMGMGRFSGGLGAWGSAVAGVGGCDSRGRKKRGVLSEVSHQNWVVVVVAAVGWVEHGLNFVGLDSIPKSKQTTSYFYSIPFLGLQPSSINRK